MCNLYSMTKSQAAIREWIRAMRDTTGNLPPLPGIFPDMMAPIVRTSSDDQRELGMARWGMPSPPRFVTGIDRGVTNIRNVSSPHWRGWMKPEFRCLVPATSFCEYTDKAPKVPTWFALGADRPLFAFAGIWCRWRGTRGTKKNPVEGEHTLFGFLTTEAGGKDVIADRLTYYHAEESRRVGKSSCATSRNRRSMRGRPRDPTRVDAIGRRTRYDHRANQGIRNYP